VSGDPVRLKADSVRRARWRAAAGWWAAAAGFAAVAGRFAPLTVLAEAMVLVAGGALTAWALGVGFTRPVPALERRQAPETIDPRGRAAWVAVLVAWGLLEIHSLVSADPAAYPTLSALSRPLLAPPDHRSLGYLIWLASGVWVARR
jgi:hypothetical protein